MSCSCSSGCSCGTTRTVGPTPRPEITLTTAKSITLSPRADGGPNKVIVTAVDVDITLPFGSQAGEAITIISPGVSVTVFPGSDPCGNSTNTMCNGVDQYLQVGCVAVTYTFVPTVDPCVCPTVGVWVGHT